MFWEQGAEGLASSSDLTQYTVESIVSGQTVTDVLRLGQHDGTHMVEALRADVDRALKAGLLDISQADRLIQVNRYLLAERDLAMFCIFWNLSCSLEKRFQRAQTPG